MLRASVGTSGGVRRRGGVGGGIEADLLALLDGWDGGGNEGGERYDRYEDDDCRAVRDATRALWLLTGATAFDDPAKAARRLAAVALHAPGRDWGGDELDGVAEGADGVADGGAEGGASNAEGDDSDAEDERGEPSNAVGGGGGRTALDAAGRAAPKLSTRVIAAAMISAVPSFVSAHPAHLDLALARRSRGDRWLCAQADALVDLGHRLATSASEPLRPRGLALLTRLVETLGDARDPDVPGSALLEQFQAQVLSALRAAAAARGDDRDGDSGESSSSRTASSVADPASVLEGLALASASLVDGRVTGGDPAATRRVVDFVVRSAVAALSLDQSDPSNDESRIRRERDDGACEGITARLRVATSRALAVAATHAPDALATALAKANVDAPRNRCELWWRRVLTRSDALATDDLSSRPIIARDLARAAGPALEALALASSSSSSSSSVFDACAAAFRAAAASGSFPSGDYSAADSTDSGVSGVLNDAAFFEELFEPLNPPPGRVVRGDGDAGGGVDVVAAARALRLALDALDSSSSSSFSSPAESAAVSAVRACAATLVERRRAMGTRVVSDSTFVRECAATLASSARATASAVNRGGASPPSAEAPPPPPPPSEWTLATAALGAAIAGSVPASSPHFRVSLVALDAMLASSESTRPEDGAAMSAPLLALATSAAVDDASGGSSHQNGDVLARLFARAALECPETTSRSSRRRARWRRRAMRSTPAAASPPPAAVAAAPPA